MRAFSLRILLALAGVSFFGPLITPAHAADYTFTWVGFGDGLNWSDGENWRNGSSPYPIPGPFPLVNDAALFTTRLQPIGYVQSYNIRLDMVAYLTSMIFTGVPDPEVPNARFRITVPSSYRLYVSEGITASTADAADFVMNGTLAFGGNVTVNNLTGSGFIFTSLASGTFTQVGPSGNYTGMISNGGDLDDGNPPLYTTSLTVGDGTQAASLSLAPSNPSLNPNRYSGTTLVKANATLVGGVAGALSARSAHVIDGTLSLAGGSSTVTALSGTGTVNLGANALTVAGGGTFEGTVSGAGGSLIKAGSGTLTLTGSNAYTGGTTISGGTFVLGHDHGAGTGTVTVAGGVYFIEAGVTGTNNAVKLSGGGFDRALAGGSDLENAVNATSSFAEGAPDTTAQILQGTLTSGTTLATSFSGSSNALNDAIRLSDVYSFEGTGSDVFVLELSFTSTEPEASLGWLSGTQWVNARDGNTANNPLYAAQFDGTFAEFQGEYGTTLNSYIGAWGVDVSGGVTSTWAVLNHNSDFSVVPEPAAVTLIFLGGTLGLLRRRRIAGR